MTSPRKNPEAFDLATFRSLCREEEITWRSSSLKNLIAGLTRTPPIGGQQVIDEIRRLSPEKRAKYKGALRYLLFSWPQMIQPGELTYVDDGRSPRRETFANYYAVTNRTTDFSDLLYGTSNARLLAPYRPPLGNVRFADDFNNASNIGGGLAFGRQWNGTGLLDATPTQVRDSVRRGDPGHRLRENTRLLHVNALLNSRYDPALSLHEPRKRLHADTHQSLQAMRERHRSDAKEHYWMHARFVKSVRRACKGGIAMVASHPCYTHAGAKVHFVLDGLGDLGRIARKEVFHTDKDGYVAITSSELVFCCRYWNDPQFPLHDAVWFYINGERVLPPWEADYRTTDGTKAMVYSNQEAWLRYRLSTALLSESKPFPRMGGTANAAAFGNP